MSFNRRLGENVSFTADGLTGGPGQNAVFELHDANMNVRVLQSYERLVIDSLALEVVSGGATGPVQAFIYFGGNTSGAYPPAAHVLLAASAIADPTTSNVAIHATYSANNGEGVSLPAGTLPWFFCDTLVSGVSTGTGRIVNAKTAGVRPPYRERLNA